MSAPTPPDGSPVSLLHRIHGEVADLTRRMSIVSNDVATLETYFSQPDFSPATSAPATSAPVPHPAPGPAATPEPPAAPSAAPPAVPFVAAPSVAPAFTPPATPPFATPHHLGPQFATRHHPAPLFVAAPPPPHQQPGHRGFPQTPGFPPPAGPGSQTPPPHRFVPAPPHASMSERIAAATERGLVGTILAIAGVMITLTGVVFLLVLAAQAGLLRPEIRVAGGALLATALFGAGLLLGRRDDKRVGASALIATGVATALFDVLAATAIYQWLPGYVGLIVAGAIAAGGLAVAHLWNSQTLGLIAGIALVVFAPLLTGGPSTLLVGFLLTYTAATIWIQLRRNWTAMFAVNTAIATLPLIVLAVVVADSDRWQFVTAAAVNVLLALGSAVILLRWSTRSLLLALFSVASILPMLGTGSVAGAAVGTVALSLVTVGLAVVAMVGSRIPGATLAVRTVWLVTSAVTAVAALGAILDGTGMGVGVAGIGVVVAVASCFGTQLSTALRIIGTVFTGAAVFATMPLGALQMMFVSNLNTSDQAMLLMMAIIALIGVGVLVWAWTQHRPTTDQQVFAIVGGLISLGLVTEICVGLGALISGGTDSGIRGGHAAATIVWVLSAAAGLLWARRLGGSARAVTITVSLAVIAAAVAKLFLFDLSALDGVFRVIAFIVVGLLLLSLGAAYAQSLGSPTDTDAPERIGGQPQAPGLR